MTMREKVARAISIAHGDGEEGASFGANLDAADSILSLLDDEVRRLREEVEEIADDLLKPTQPMIANPYAYYAGRIKAALRGGE